VRGSGEIHLGSLDNASIMGTPLQVTAVGTITGILDNPKLRISTALGCEHTWILAVSYRG